MDRFLSLDSEQRGLRVRSCTHDVAILKVGGGHRASTGTGTNPPARFEVSEGMAAPRNLPFPTEFFTYCGLCNALYLRKGGFERDRRHR